MIKLQEKFDGKVKLFNPTVDPDRLPFFVLGRPSAIKYALNEENSDLRLAPIRPFLEAEFWDEGVQITDLKVISEKIANTKWRKYLADIVQLPQFSLVTD